MVTCTVLVNGSAFSVPRLLEQLLCAQHPGTGFEEGFEHGEFLGREFELSCVAADGAGAGIELDSCRTQCAAVCGGLAAGERADAEDELGEVKRLG
jgi:hypothetical protein